MRYKIELIDIGRLSVVSGFGIRTTLILVINSGSKPHIGAQTLDFRTGRSTRIEQGSDYL